VKGKNILICSSEDVLRVAATKAMKRCGSHVVLATSASEARVALKAGVVHLIVVDIASIPDAVALLEHAHGLVPAIALTSGSDLNLLDALVGGASVAHIIAHEATSPQGIAEMLITADKLLRDDLFGLGKYLRGKDTVMHTATLTCATDRDVQLRALSEFLVANKAPRPALATIVNAADEMLTNAMYNAPVDDLGLPLYASTNRRTKIRLAEDEYVELRYGVCKGVFGMSVADKFGGLRHGHLSKSIRRCVSSDDPIEQKAGGAGLGLFMLARTAHQFVVNVDPGNRTEVIALWNLDRKSLRVASSHHSLHYFEQAVRLKTRRNRPKHAMGTRSPSTGDYGVRPATMPGLGLLTSSRDATEPSDDVPSHLDEERVTTKIKRLSTTGARRRCSSFSTGSITTIPS